MSHTPKAKWLTASSHQCAKVYASGRYWVKVYQYNDIVLGTILQTGLLRLMGKKSISEPIPADYGRTLGPVQVVEFFVEACGASALFAAAYNHFRLRYGLPISETRPHANVIFGFSGDKNLDNVRVQCSTSGSLVFDYSAPIYPMLGYPKKGLIMRSVDKAGESTHTARYKKLRDLLVSARREAGLTQAEVAAALRKPQSYISKIESGERRMDLLELLDFLRAVEADEVRFITAMIGRRGR